MFQLEFETDKDAFENCAASETARIMRAVAQMIEAGHLQGAVIDGNGNVVGTYQLDGK